MTNETPRQGVATATRADLGRPAHTTPAAAQAARIAMARRSAAQLATNLALDRARRHAGRGWESAMCPAMPQSGWLAALEHDLMAWLNEGGFAAGKVPPAGIDAQTKTAA